MCVCVCVCVWEWVCVCVWCVCVCVCVCVCTYLPISWGQIGTQKWAKPDKSTHTHTHTKPFEDVLICKTVFFAICEHTAGYKGEELIRDVSDGIKYSILHYITPCDTVYRGITMVETAHYYNSSEKCSCSVDSVIYHTALTVNSV